MYAFDAYGFYTGTVEKSDSNATDIQPPECESGKLPRFVDGAWVCDIKDWEDIWAAERLAAAETATRSAKDKAKERLAEIDRLSDSPRARREAMLGDTSWMKSLNAEAAKLRSQL